MTEISISAATDVEGVDWLGTVAHLNPVSLLPYLAFLLFLSKSNQVGLKEEDAAR